LIGSLDLQVLVAKKKSERETSGARWFLMSTFLSALLCPGAWAGFLWFEVIVVGRKALAGRLGPVAPHTAAMDWQRA
jgi:hypothetical protein